MPNFSISTVLAENLALFGGRKFADTVITKVVCHVWPKLHNKVWDVCIILGIHWVLFLLTYLHYNFFRVEVWYIYLLSIVLV